jgi:hypothetical protein
MRVFLLRLALMDNMEGYVCWNCILGSAINAFKWNELPIILLVVEILRHSVQNVWISLLLAQESVCHVMFGFRNT